MVGTETGRRRSVPPRGMLSAAVIGTMLGWSAVHATQRDGTTSAFEEAFIDCLKDYDAMLISRETLIRECTRWARTREQQLRQLDEQRQKPAPREQRPERGLREQTPD